MTSTRPTDLGRGEPDPRSAPDASRIASVPLPPGPRSRSLSGTRDEARQDALGFYTRLARDYPRIASVRAYWIRLVLVTEPTLIQQLLRSGPEGVVGARSRRALRVALGDGLLTAEGEVWRRERALVQPAFRHDRLQSYAPMIVRRSVAARDNLRDGEPIDLHQLATGLTLGIIAEALFGAELSGRVTEVGDGLAHVMNRFEEVFIRSRLPLPLRLPTPRNLRLRGAIRRLHDVVDDIVDRRMSASDTAGDDLLTDLIAATRLEGTTDARRRLRDEVLTLLLAGHETTALVVTFALLLLSRHPDEERAVSEELDAAFGGRDPDAQTLAKLPRLRRVVQETMRLYPPAWALGRQAARDLELGGYRIPRGAQIFVMPWVTHRDPRWFRDADRFWSDRWVSEETDTDPPPVTRDAYFPFGAGPRACVGAGLAMLEAPLVLATLLAHWRFEVPADFEPQLQPAITLRPRTGVPAVARRR